MKKRTKKDKGVVKGAPSGFVISILIHAAAFSLAGLLVVFNVVQKEEKKFVPPKPVDRPKMKLKKPKVKVKKTSKPKSSTRIVTKVKRASMPDIQLPEMSGMGEGLAGGIGGFEIIPDLDEVTLFGGGQSIGNDFVGTFYDVKRTRRGTSNGMDPDAFKEVVAKFVRNGWKPSSLAQYYRSPKKLYATSFMVPTVRSSTAPAAFGEPDTGGWCWLAHYKGSLVHKDGITFRFRGQGDDIMVVRVDGKEVLNASWPGTDVVISKWQSNDSKNRTYKMGNNTAVVGDWITLEPGVPVDMEVIGGEVPGGHFDMMLVVEEEDVEYELNPQQGPILPMFKTAYPSFDLIDEISKTMVAEEFSITNGPIFCDFESGRGSDVVLAREEEPVAVEPAPEEPVSKLRIWTMKSGKTTEAEYVSTIGDKVVLKSSRGKQIRIPAVEMSQEDLKFISLSNPPEFNISFSKQSGQRIIETSPFLNEEAPRIFDWTFGAKLKQTTARSYDYPLTVEYFAIGEQYLDDDKFILFDRQTSTFTPTRENDRSHNFRGERTVETMNYSMHSNNYGQKYMGYLITVTDIRGEIIQYAASNDWLYENLENLKKIPIGRYFDDTCTRVHPSGPKRYY
ncbi:SHD1 domain-containing protein [Pontiellaceae bacterium B12227]|nr:SHD1 domain-containing protein [Pontiellaceae bacterium B12227]